MESGCIPDYDLEMRLLAVCLASLSLISLSAVSSRHERCETVAGSYSIYANGDRLHIEGSRHLLSVVIDSLDSRLQAAGWETAVARGEFTICYEKPVAPRDLTVSDVVRVKNFSKIRILVR
jgi:hypothetical protein